MLSVLVNVNTDLATRVAEGLGMEVPAAQPLVRGQPMVRDDSTIKASVGLSLFARPGELGVAGRKVAVLVTPGFDGEALGQVNARLLAAGAWPRLVGSRLGSILNSGGSAVEVEATLESMPSVLWDAVVLWASAKTLPALCANGQVLEFVREQYRHGKAIFALGQANLLLSAAGVVEADSPYFEDPGVVVAESVGDDTLEAWLKALARHRHFERELDPPLL
jgi:catalase